MLQFRIAKPIVIVVTFGPLLVTVLSNCPKCPPPLYFPLKTKECPSPQKLKCLLQREKYI